jgi:hypothetical protein
VGFVDCPKTEMSLNLTYKMIFICQQNNLDNQRLFWDNRQKKNLNSFLFLSVMNNIGGGGPIRRKDPRLVAQANANKPLM